MSHALVVLWLGTAASRAAHAPDLDSWATARLVVLEEPSADAALPEASHDDGAAGKIEALLSEARTSAYSEDPAAAAGAADAAIAAATGQAGLPEAALLLAEALRIRAEVASRTEPELARDLERRATVLDGGHASAFAPVPANEGQRGAASRSRPSPPIAAIESEAATRSPGGARVPLDGPRPSDVVDVDGSEVPYPPTLSPGLHHVRVLRGHRLAWAGWVTAELGVPARALVPVAAACSEADLARARLARDAVDPGAAVSCERYAVARAAGPERIEIAMCRGPRCGPLLPWSRSWGTSFEGPAHPPWPAPRRDTWISWVAGGTAAAITSGLLLWQGGAFERRGATRETFTFVPPERAAR